MAMFYLLVAGIGMLFSPSTDSSGRGKLVSIVERTSYPAKKSMSFRETIVDVATIEYNRWRTDSTLREDDGPAVPLVQKYWKILGWRPSTTQVQDSLWEENHPWSAAFISWVMNTAGAGSKFKYATNHAAYIVWARKNAKMKGKQPVFRAYDICDPRAAWPEPGDLICKNRDGKSFSLQTITSNDISHSDIVVEVDKASGTITTIGGNLRNTVNKRIIHLDADGFIDKTSNWLIPDDEVGNPTGSQGEFFAIIKTR